MSHDRVSLQFTNEGATTCTLDGYPGVSFVAGDDGHQVGVPARRDGTPEPVLLATGQVAHADLDVVAAQAFPATRCRPTPVRGLRVYPPDQTASAFIPYPGTGCRSTDPQFNVLNTGPVQEGAGSAS